MDNRTTQVGELFPLANFLRPNAIHDPQRGDDQRPPMQAQLRQQAKPRQRDRRLAKTGIEKQSAAAMGPDDRSGDQPQQRLVLVLVRIELYHRIFQIALGPVTWGVSRMQRRCISGETQPVREFS